jgi:hypothetical protein
VIPTLRNRNRGDLPRASVVNNEEIESITGPTNEDATAELNQGEMIEANQIMVVFDKQLVNY